MNVHPSAGVKNLVADVFNPTVEESSKDLIDEMELEDQEKVQIISPKEQKVSCVALKTFENCHDIESFHSIAEGNVASIKAAALILKGEHVDEEDYGKFTISLISVAKERLSSKELTESQMDLGRKLETYASRLETVYKEMELDLIFDVILNKKQLMKTDWVQSTKETVQQASANEQLIGELEQNFKGQKVRLFDKKNEPIDLPPYSGEGTFTSYLHDEVLPVLMTHLSMTKEEMEEGNFNEDALSILEFLKVSITELKEYSAQLDLESTDSEGNKEKLQGAEREKFNEFMGFLNKMDTPNVKKLRFILTAMGSQVADNSSAHMIPMAGIANTAEGKVEMDLTGREIEVHIEEKGSPVVISTDSYSPKEFAEGTILHLATKVELDGEELTDVKPDYEISLSGKPEESEFERLRHVIDLAGFQCKIQESTPYINAKITSPPSSVLTDLINVVKGIFTSTEKELEIYHLGLTQTPSMVSKGEGLEMHLGDYFYERISIRTEDGRIYTYGKQLEPFVTEWIEETKEGETDKDFQVWMGERVSGSEDTKAALTKGAVRYFDDVERMQTEVTVGEDGRLVQIGLDSEDDLKKPLKEGDHAFVIGQVFVEDPERDSDGYVQGKMVTKFYSTPKVKTAKGKIQHSGFMRGGIVKTAGVLKVDGEGNVISIKNQSGHYRPTPKEMAMNIKYLMEAGYDVSKMHVIYPKELLYLHLEVHFDLIIEWGFVNQRADKWYEETGQYLIK